MKASVIMVAGPPRLAANRAKCVCYIKRANAAHIKRCPKPRRRKMPGQRLRRRLPASG